jgi:hypothetical protein
MTLVAVLPEVLQDQQLILLDLYLHHYREQQGAKAGQVELRDQTHLTPEQQVVQGIRKAKLSGGQVQVLLEQLAEQVETGLLREVPQEEQVRLDQEQSYLLQMEI